MAREETVVVPDIGDFSDVEVIEVLVKPGDRIDKEQSLITLESEKAAMEIPSPLSGTVTALDVSTGDRVSRGSPILKLSLAEGAASQGTEAEAPEPGAAAPEAARPEPTEPEPAEAAKEPEAEPEEVVGVGAGAAKKAPAGKREAQAQPPPRPPLLEPRAAASEPSSKPHASPSVRRYARKLGADLTRIQGSGRKGRILAEDVETFVKSRLQARETLAGWMPAEIPAPDYASFGEVETRTLSRVKKRSGPNLHRNWLAIPHVTQHDEADITDLEALRKTLKEETAGGGIRVTLLPFVLKAVAAALKAHPNVNASLAPSGDALVLKKYYHIGVAVDTPEGLVVPVVFDVERKGILELAAELAEISQRARERRLQPADLQGASFTVSSLGGIGGTAFTPIINAPEVAILGVSRAAVKPVYADGEFVPRLMLPLSLSYDHRVIDGAEAARFTTHLRRLLSDMRRILL